MKCDEWHTHESKSIIGIAESLFQAIKLCEENGEKENEPLSAEDKRNLYHIKQTQSYTGDGQYMIEEHELNKLL